MSFDLMAVDSRTLFTTLADRTRLRILHALMGADELCVCNVAHVLGMSVAAASQPVAVCVLNIGKLILTSSLRVEHFVAPRRGPNQTPCCYPYAQRECPA